MAAEQMFNKAGGVLKRVPKWAWYTSAGVAVAGVVIYSIQHRKQVAVDAASDTNPDATGAVGSPYANIPGVVTIPVAEPSSGEGSYGEFATGLQGNFFDAIGGIQGAEQEFLATVVDYLHPPSTGGGSDSVGGNDTSGSSVPEAAPPPPPPEPTPPPEPAPTGDWTTQPPTCGSGWAAGNHIAGIPVPGSPL